MVNLLIVDDSSTIREYFEYILGQDPDINIVGKACNGKEALSFVKKLKPDIIAMDIDMPVMDGLEATRQIMSSTPIPIIIVTARRNAKNKEVSMEALASGALTVVEKPAGIKSANNAEYIQLTKLIKTYSKVKVLTRRNLKRPAQPSKLQVVEPKQTIPDKEILKQIELISIGVSTGGPEVLKTIISSIPANFPVPIVAVQHITPGFLDSMVSWLNSISPLHIKVAENGEFIKPGVVYFAPDKQHMTVVSNKIKLIKNMVNNPICPSVDALFRSLLDNASKTLALLLTGMGSDGALAMKELYDRDALTVAQDKASSLIHGMPGEAIKINAVKHVLDLAGISKLLNNINELMK